MFNNNIQRATIVSCLSVLALLGCSEKTHTINATQHQAITIKVDGPETSEQAKLNPFTDYRVVAEITQGNNTYQIRGYYAADGTAQESSATQGNQWHIKFRPQFAGEWQYKVHFDTGSNIALSQNLNEGQPTEFDGQQGKIHVAANNDIEHDILTVKNGYFYYKNLNKGILKVGANSPENLLGYVDFDGTYRVAADTKDIGKASTKNLHKYNEHAQDWQQGDPSWQQGKGKNLIGAVNYLANKGMNAIYFVTMNIGGDGKDVWPYVDHNTLDRFDVSKLAQWEQVFQHMEDKNMIMHFILQETENELLLDKGDTGPKRKLYLNEMIARFAHHAGIIWNVGEENGPVHFSPEGQTPEQAMAMASYIKNIDPYQQPVFIHTHASWKHKEETLPKFMGFKDFDGLSLQVDQPKTVTKHITRWQEKAKEAGHPLAITMDEIGLWHTGALPDSEDPNHDIMRQQVMWPSFMLNSAGVEWYFGYKYAHNDLNAEDWRSRDLLWDQTFIAKQFFTDNNIFDLTTRCVNQEGIYCLTNRDKSSAIIYTDNIENESLGNLSISGEYKARWFNPKSGQIHESSALVSIAGGKLINLQQPPKSEQSDWALVLNK
ncbi:DUF5060 domain-containing protein [Saccharobesus litoralis]|uniref:DUF5060 domain-containing protein n=1 Tax=Saccharobesus litoralis TaxID=2172099 RepID=A0A2S0VSW9_9ALTE|nr:DUF5060 domain-containing protein [Saccharobesus litoralis]AWB67311.1 DUF5060 domain-containing protein [Saccharobesus litoralis]